MTPNTQGVLHGAKPKNGQRRFDFKSSVTTRATKQKDPKDLPAPVKTLAQAAALNIPKEIMQEKDNSKYVELLVEKITSDQIMSLNLKLPSSLRLQLIWKRLPALSALGIILGVKQEIMQMVMKKSRVMQGEKSWLNLQHMQKLE